MNKILAKQLSARILELTQEAIQKEFGLEVRQLGGSFGSTEFKLKLQISEPIKNMVTNQPVTISNDMLHAGLGERGTRVTHGNKQYAIISARRSKYLVEPVPATGKQYVVPFESVNLYDRV